MPTMVLAADEVVSGSGLTSSDWITAGAIFLASIVVALAVSRVARRVLEHAIGKGFSAILISRFLAYGVVVVGLYYSLIALGVRVGPLLGALGLGGLVLALALQRVVENFVAALIVQTARPYNIGDTVELDGHLGVVADVDTRTTLLHGIDGTHIRVPNATVISTVTINLTAQESRRSTITVGVAYATNLALATRVLYEATSRVERVAEFPRPAVNLLEFGDSSIVFEVHVWHGSDVPTALATRHDLLLAIHQGFESAGITIAFPQLTVWSGPAAEAAAYSVVDGSVATPYPETGDDAVPRTPGALRRWLSSAPADKDG